MKRIISLILFVCSIILPLSSLAEKEVYRFSIGKYEVGVDIAPGDYTVTTHEKNHFASKVTIGDHLNAYGDPIDGDYVRFSLVHPNNKSLMTPETVESYTIVLENGQSIYVHTDDVIFRLNNISSKGDEKKEEQQNGVSAEAENVKSDGIYARCQKLPADAKSAAPIPGERYVVDLEDPTQYEWSSSNSDVVTIFDNGTFVSMKSGKATITGKPKDGSGNTIKIALTVNIPYVSSKDIVIDSPEGAELITYLGSGIIMTSYTGDDCFKTEEIDSTSLANRERILPVKEGKGSIVYEINFKKKIKVNITVKKSAMMTEDERVALAEKAENAQEAIVTKGVNIRSDATSDSAKIGYANSGDHLVVTQAFYSSKWHQILYNGQTGYVSAKYVNINME